MQSLHQKSNIHQLSIRGKKKSTRGKKKVLGIKIKGELQEYQNQKCVQECENKTI